MSKGHVVNCAHLIKVDWLRQAVLIFDDLDKAQKELGRFGANCICGVGGAGYAVNEIDGSGLFWMIFPGGKPSISSIVHECVHVVDYLLEFAGIPVDSENVEVRCYMTEWLVAEALVKYGMNVKRK